jgi:hypothetical protein
MDYPILEQTVRKSHQARILTTYPDQEDYIGWFTIDRSSKGMIAQFDKWVEQNIVAKSKDKQLKQQIHDEWRKLLKDFNPSFPYRSIIMSHEKGKCEMHPIYYNFNKDGFHEAHIGWKALWKNIIIEPPYRIISISSRCFKLYEIRAGNPELRIELPNSKDGRYVTLKEFITSVKVLCAHEPGPLVIVGTQKRNPDLDSWMITANLPVQAIWLETELQSIKQWWEIMLSKGVTIFWRKQWTKHIIYEAQQKNTFIDTPELLNRSLKMNRLKYILLPENILSESLYSFMKEIINRKISIIRSDLQTVVGIRR